VTIVGAGPAGLAVAGCLKQRGVTALLLEASPEVGSAWRRHYDRLHLHTHKGGSALPGLPFPSDTPRYPSREQVIAYLEGYARHFRLEPALDEAVRRVAREGDLWVVTTSKRQVASKHVVIATGNTRVPVQPTWPGLDSFKGEVLHSSRYQNGAAWAGKRVLVVGLGNSGGEIAIDLHEHGAKATIAVRSPVNVIPRELFGLPILAASALFRPFPPRVADALGAPLLALSIGDITKLGLRRLPYGVMEQITRHGRIPLIDVGTLALVRDGQVKIAPGIDRFTETSAVFEGGATEPFDAAVLATGYRPALEDFLPSAPDLCDEHGFPRADGEVSPGLHLCGFRPSTRGMLREIGIEARRTARRITAAG
jgi:NADPH-dependent 2,4-dienoyl-CoA reductase/sulfur reductase-like enzyme